MSSLVFFRQIMYIEIVYYLCPCLSCRAVEIDEYSYITATYYLLIERHMRKERQEQAQRLITALTKSDSQLQLASLALSPR